MSEVPFILNKSFCSFLLLEDKQYSVFFFFYVVK